MNRQKQKSFNGLVYEMAYKRLNLKRREKIILQRLLGFLIRNDKPFPFSIDKLSELTGYARRSIFESLNILQDLRLVDRVGFTSHLRFQNGRILTRICSLVQKRINIELRTNYPLVQKLHETASASAETAYNKTSLSLKHKDKEDLSTNIEKEKRQSNYKASGQQAMADIMKKLTQHKGLK
jgi:hemerythrin superfamily protein